MTVTEEDGDRDADEPMLGDAKKFMGKICQSEFFRGVNHQLLCMHLTTTEIY